MRRTTALLVAAVLAAACSEDAGQQVDPGPTTTSTTPTTAAGPVELPAADDLYAAVPDPVPPGAPGEVLAYQELDPGALPASRLLRVLYRSESIAGDPIAVSGIIAVPEGEAGADGGRPVLSWAHGTTGIADVCAPSRDAGDAVGFLAPFLERGMVVVATDYEGRGVLDIVRAARDLDVGAGDEVVLWGHSQGGHAVLFANQIAPEWAPELSIVGTVAGAPPSQLSLIAAALQGGPYQYYILMTGAGWAEAFGADLSLVATDRALELLPAVDEVCAGDLAEVFNPVPPDELLRADPATVEPWASLLVENDPGHVAGPSPVLIIHGEADEQIPVVSSQLLLDRMCSVGQVVERRTYPGQSHSGVIAPSFADMLTWIDDRLEGTPPASSCP